MLYFKIYYNGSILSEVSLVSCVLGTPHFAALPQSSSTVSFSCMLVSFCKVLFQIQIYQGCISFFMEISSDFAAQTRYLLEIQQLRVDPDHT